MWGNYSFDYACSLARGRSGGLISIWGPNLFVKENIWCDEAFIIVKGRWRNTVGDCYMINLYGPHDPLAKVALWNKVLNFLQSHSGKYILFGDMNEVRSEQERRGSIFSHNKADVFNSFINNTGFIDLPMGGHMFTWTNKAGSKLSKLDKFLISKEVVSLLPDIKITSLDRLWSDHSPILLHCTKCDFGPIPFKFYHSWFNRECINEVISSKFNNLANPTDGRKLIFHEKLQALKPKIKHWVATTKSNEDSHKQVLLKDLSVLDEKIDVGLAYSNNREMRIKLLQEADTLANFEAMDMIQKARIKWDVEGDENTKFFHCLINQKRRTQSINNIMQEGVWITNPIQIKEAFLNFLKDKFKANDSSITFPPARISSTLQPFDREYLESNITMDEVKNAVWECGSDKAPGPDGFTFAFVKRYWDILKLNIFEFVSTFLSSKMMPTGSNSSFINLIPKVINPIHIKDFWPISIIGIHYKIIGKILANRLSKVVGKIVSYEQSTFIKDRQILDGPLILSEVIDWTSILINDSPTSEFNVRRGLRQRDHLSPFLFIIIMEGLHRLITDSVQSGLIRGITFGFSNLTLSHLFFTDDVVITTDWSRRDMDNIIRFFQVFYLASGLKLNIHKSNIYGIVVSTDDVHLMASNTGCVAGTLPFTYLGLPIGGNMSLNENWKPLIDKFKAKLSGWKANLLSFGGRLTLIKSVLGSLVEISHLNIQANIDKCIWSLDNDAVFTVGALRRLIDNHLLPSLVPTTTWDKTIPRKVNIEISLFEIYGGPFAYGVIALSILSSPTRIGLTGGVRGPSLEIKSVVCLSSSRPPFGSFGGTVTTSLLILTP
ncbi:putative RNA-directed DNA polymerase, eukaryota, reverse transcriptase zinc-binding domain protein [Tanacetum coccineum]